MWPTRGKWHGRLLSGTRTPVTELKMAFRVTGQCWLWGFDPAGVGATEFAAVLSFAAVGFQKHWTMMVADY